MAADKKQWLADHVDSVAILLLTIAAFVIILVSADELASYYNVPAYKGLGWCGENSQLPCR